MPTYRLVIEYEGTRYHGWQEQQNARTVAGELRRAIEKVAGRVQELGGSGRTDAGVHALAQSAHLRVPADLDPERFRREVNELLPADIHLLGVRLIDNRFHARHSAVSRSYLYQISQRRTAFGKRYVWWVKRPLDVARMQRAAALLPGRHDFVRFCEHRADQTSTLVEVTSASVARFEALIVIRLEASHFLWKMVRRVVGTLVAVGGGELQLDGFRSLLAGQELPAGAGAPAEWTAPPSGLFLERIRYEGEPALMAIAPAIPVSAERPGTDWVAAPEVRSAPPSRTPARPPRAHPAPRREPPKPRRGGRG
jgi:tRNA pseudouridine38-40 synthase